MRHVPLALRKRTNNDDSEMRSTPECSSSIFMEISNKEQEPDFKLLLYTEVQIAFFLVCYVSHNLPKNFITL